MRIVVVGTIVADTIEHTDGTVTESLGGIAHTISALSALAGDRRTILPVCRVGADCREAIESWAAGLPGVSLAAAIPDAGPQPRVRLSYRDAERCGERVERLSHLPAPLEAAELDIALAGTDLVLLNCITGADVSPSGLDRLAGCGARRYLDVHSLALGMKADGERFYRGREDWEAWLAFADVVQCNLAEAGTICGLTDADEAVVMAAVQRLLEGAGAEAAGAEVGSEVAGADAEGAGVGAEGAAPPAVGDNVAKSPPPAVSVWLLTLGAAGAVLFRRRPAGIAITRFPAPVVPTADPTGAGDAFGAAYVTAWLDGVGAHKAVARAVAAGAAACMQEGMPEPVAFCRDLDDLMAS